MKEPDDPEKEARIQQIMQDLIEAKKNHEEAIERRKQLKLLK